MSTAEADRSTAALHRYQRRMRRPRAISALTLITLAAVLLAGVKLAYDRGEISHATLRTVARAPAAVPLQPTAPSMTRRWRTADRPAVGTPVAGGTVVTYDAHTVRGRNLRTGAATWSYTRTDRTVCTAIQVAQVTIAVYALGGDCDELTAVDTGTGQREWTRTLFTDGARFAGPASYTVTASSVLFVSRTSIYALSPAGSADAGNGGLDYWRFSQPGCIITGAVLGSAGALISQTCHRPPCAGLTHCADGPQLLLRPATNPGGTAPANNPDYIRWLRPGRDLVPVSAGSAVTALTRDGSTLETLSSRDGTITGTTPLIAPAAPPADGHAAWPGAAPHGIDTAAGSLLWLGAESAYLPAGASTPAWQRATTGPATVVPRTASGQITAPTPSGPAWLTTTRGAVRQRWPVPTPAGAAVTPAGRGLLVGGASGTAYFA